MQRRRICNFSSYTTYDRNGRPIEYWEGVVEYPIGISRDKPEIFEAFCAAVRADENAIEIAQRFETDHCTVFYWKRKLGVVKQAPAAD